MSSSERDLEGSDDAAENHYRCGSSCRTFHCHHFLFSDARQQRRQRRAGFGRCTRPGAPEFDQNIAKLYLDPPEADEAKRALGDIVMNLQTTVRNFTGRTVNGLEVKAAVVDGEGKPVKQRTVVVIPTKQAELLPNGTMLVVVRLDGMKDSITAPISKWK